MIEAHNPAPARGAALREYLLGLTLHGVKLGLSNMEHLMAASGHPHHAYPVVHVAGTNGKGSVVAMADAIMRAAGLATGRYTSPHLIDVAERFLVNGGPMDEAALCENIDFIQGIARSMDPPPTFFEACTAIAFRHFARRQIDVALIEVGMGGRLDATNVVQPTVCAITNIDLEHTQYLGDTLAAIAAEKAGIIKPGVPVVVGETRPEPRDVILAKAQELDAPVSLLGRDFQFTCLETKGGAQEIAFSGRRWNLPKVTVPLAGTHQCVNAAVALAAAEELAGAFPGLDAHTAREGIAAARWPGRLERVLDQPPVLIDVAHNAAGAARLAEAVPQCVAVMAVSSDKDAAAMIRTIHPRCRALILTTFAGKRSLDLASLQAAAGGLAHQTADSLREAIELALPLASSDCPLLITGSIYTAGEARQILMDHHGAPPLCF